MGKKYLDDIGLAYFFDKLKSIFITREEVEEETSLIGSGSGVVVASDGVMVESLTVYGKSVQNGTPTLSEPVPVKVVNGSSMPSNIAWRQGSVSNSTGNEGSDANRIHTAMFEIIPGATYTVGITNSSYQYSVRLFSGTQWVSSDFLYGDSIWKSANETYNNKDAKYMCVVIRRTDDTNISPSDSENIGVSVTTSSIGLIARGRNLFDTPIAGWISGAANTFLQLNGVGGSSGTLFIAEIPSNTTFTISAKLYTGMDRFRIALFDADPRSGAQFEIGHSSQVVNINNPATDQTYTFSSSEFTWVVLGLSTSATSLNLDAQAQLEFGSEATQYVAPNAVIVGGIDLQGNVLASMPDGTQDVLTVDSAGHCVLTKRTGLYHVTGSETAVSRTYGNYIRAVLSNVIADHPSPQYSSASGYCTHAPFVGAPSQQSVHAYTVTTAVVLFDVATNVSQVLAAYAGADVYYKLATQYTVDLGYIDMPAIPEGATISINASMTPVTDISWWTAFAEPIANASQETIKKFSADYIVEEGEDNGWHYRKWNSGIAECWGGFEHNNVAITNAWGALYESTTSFYETFPSGLFNATPDYCGFNWSPAVGSKAILSIELSQGLTNERTQSVYLSRNATATVSGILQIHAKGTWK